MSIDSDQTINNNIIRLDGADAVFGVSGDSNVILGPNTEVFLSNSNTSISSDIDVDGDGNIINQGLIVADGTVGTPNRSICLDQFTNSGNLQAINGAELHICGSWFNDDGTVTVDGTSRSQRMGLTPNLGEPLLCQGERLARLILSLRVVL